MGKTAWAAWNRVVLSAFRRRVCIHRVWMKISMDIQYCDRISRGIIDSALRLGYIVPCAACSTVWPHFRYFNCSTNSLKLNNHWTLTNTRLPLDWIANVAAKFTFWERYDWKYVKAKKASSWNYFNLFHHVWVDALFSCSSKRWLIREEDETIGMEEA